MFDLERFIEQCWEVQRTGDNQTAIRDVVAQAVSEPHAVLKALGEPTRAGRYTLHHGPKLTILNLVWGPYMSLMPHNHNMWAVIGIYTGREDNVFWRRAKDHSARVEAVGAKALGVKDCVLLGRDVIHSVLNPLPRLTAALHVYGGDFVNEARSEWDPERLTERPYDPERARGLFEESNKRLSAA